jgi:hypothetical protein
MIDIATATEAYKREDVPYIRVSEMVFENGFCKATEPIGEFGAVIDNALSTG